MLSYFDESDYLYATCNFVSKFDDTSADYLWLALPQFNMFGTYSGTCHANIETQIRGYKCS